jgi:hypothetical protein
MNINDIIERAMKSGFLYDADNNCLYFSDGLSRFNCLPELTKFAELLEAKFNPKWISVDDRFPEENSIVMTYGTGCASSEYCQAYFNNGKFQELDSCGDYFDYPPTHWMPLPNPPKDTK